MSLPESPNSRAEQYLAKIAGQETELPEGPQSRVEQYLEYIAANGTVSEEKIAEKVSTWLEENIHEDPTVVIDTSLSVSGAAADAKAAGDEITDLRADLKSVIGDVNLFTFSRPASIGEYWNNEVTKAIPSGTKLKAVLKSYDGTHLRIFRLRGYYNDSQYDALGAINQIGGNINITTEKVYIKLRFVFEATASEGVGTASVLLLLNDNSGIANEVMLNATNIATNGQNIQTNMTSIDALNVGYDWHELVEEDNKSGAYINATSGFRRNGTSISGYVTKVYDVTNNSKCRFTGTPYRVFGKAKDGTLTVLFSSAATSEEFDTSAYVKIIVCGLQANFWGSNHIKLEGYTKIESRWRNKKIVWFGTSIPAGGFKGQDNPLSYPFQVGRRLGATVYNEAVGDSGVHYRELSKVSATNPYGFNFYFVTASRCLTNTIAMMQWIGNWADYYCNGGSYKNPEEWDSTVFTSGLPSTWTDADTEAIKQFSYENKLDKYLTDDTCPDLFVFDHGYNDRIRWADNTGTYEAQLAEYGRDNCYTFRGAMNFLIDRIYSFKPTAKIIMIGDYEAQSEEKKYDSIYQTRVAEDYEIPIFKRWEKTGWSQVQETIKATWNNGLLTVSSTDATKTLLAWNLADGVHPHSDKTGGAIRQMTDLIVPFIESV